MKNRKFGNLAITAIVTVLSAISGYATAQYIKSKENEAREKEDFERKTDHTLKKDKDLC